MQEIEISPCFQIVHAQARIRPAEWEGYNSLGFCDTNGSINPDQKTGPCNKKKRTCRIVDFAVLADYREKIKVSEKRDKYLDLRTISKGLVRGLEELEIGQQAETI